MLRIAVLAIVALVVFSFAVALLVAVVTCLVLVAAVGIPLYLMSRNWSRRHGLSQKPMSAIERLQNRFAEGKIDIVEFERRVAHLVSFEP